MTTKQDRFGDLLRIHSAVFQLNHEGGEEVRTMTDVGNPHACASCRWSATRPRERPCVDCDANNNEWVPNGAKETEMTEEKRTYYAPRQWDCESVHCELDDAIEQEIDSFEGEGCDHLPETIDILELRSVPDSPSEEFVGQLVDLFDDLHGQYVDGATEKQTGHIMDLAAECAAAVYASLGLHRLEETGAVHTVNVQDWLRENTDRCEWAPVTGQDGSDDQR